MGVGRPTEGELAWGRLDGSLFDARGCGRRPSPGGTVAKGGTVLARAVTERKGTPCVSFPTAGRPRLGAAVDVHLVTHDAGEGSLYLSWGSCLPGPPYAQQRARIASGRLGAFSQTQSERGRLNCAGTRVDSARQSRLFRGFPPMLWRAWSSVVSRGQPWSAVVSVSPPFPEFRPHVVVGVVSRRQPSSVVVSCSPPFPEFRPLLWWAWSAVVNRGQVLSVVPGVLLLLWRAWLALVSRGQLFPPFSEFPPPCSGRRPAAGPALSVSLLRLPSPCYSMVRFSAWQAENRHPWSPLGSRMKESFRQGL